MIFRIEGSELAELYEDFEENVDDAIKNIIKPNRS